MDIMMKFHNQKTASIKLLGIIFLMVFSFKSIAVYQDTRPAEFAMADNELNKSYKAIYNKLSTTDRIKFKKAQRQWIIFRDSDCNNEHLDCIIERTNTRIKELQETRFFDKNGNYSSLLDRGMVVKWLS